ncbi:helix-turn-helix transcriptional regulator [Hymenobacter wooponensis]|uniref:YafY family transcriptional regulator n=1 Tax=Hymenobacter wooponensis TaxID=1525360 RepID=A0A4Z0MEK7_9BACT|nr:YafY family protein [Hymenobacter wooponensis]TGD77645.1 YafY family transcriptional regulator [Hymenobacter wooponensis]
MNRIDRLFGMVTLLQAQRYVPAERLAEHFDISVRTVYRDIRALGEQGIPVSFQAGWGYFLVPGYFLPPVSFTPEESSALLLLETLAATLADRSIQPLVAAALQKVRAVLRPPDQARLAQLDHAMQLAVPEYQEHDTHCLAPMQRAIAGRQVLNLVYRDKEGHATERRVEPIGLVFYNFTWQLVGWCQLRQGYRQFRVSRVQQLTVTTLPFTNPAPLSLPAYLASLNLPPAK